MKNAVFVALFGRCRVYEDYEDPSIPEEVRNAYCPLVLLVHRWDNRIGFPGGFVDPGEELVPALIREMREEVNLESGPAWFGDEPWHHVLPRDSASLHIHVYPMDLGVITQEDARVMISNSVDAKHFLSEGCAFWANLAQISALVDSNMLMPFVREDLLSVLERLKLEDRR